jgi:hypothetical protein
MQWFNHITEMYEYILRNKSEMYFAFLSYEQKKDFFLYVEESYFWEALDYGETDEFQNLKNYFKWKE